MKRFSMFIRPALRASALLGAVLLIGSAEATSINPNSPWICGKNPNLCIAGNQPIYGNPPPPLPPEVIPPGASVSADMLTNIIMSKIRSMSCAQLNAEASQKQEEINRLGRALGNLQSQTQALSDRKNQFDAQLNSLYSAERAQAVILRDAISTASAACRRIKGQLSDFDAAACQSAKAAQSVEQAKYNAIEDNINATNVPAGAASAALSANLSAAAYASARIEADQGIVDFIASVRVQKCP